MIGYLILVLNILTFVLSFVALVLSFVALWRAVKTRSKVENLLKDR